jgi:hypothetical protein
MSFGTESEGWSGRVQVSVLRRSLILKKGSFLDVSHGLTGIGTLRGIAVMRLLACIGFVQASPNRRGECQMLQFGNASWSFFSPASVTSVRTRLSVWSWVNPLRSARAVASCHPWRIEAAASVSRYNRGRASFPESHAHDRRYSHFVRHRAR